MMPLFTLYREFVRWMAMQDVESVASRQAQSNEEAEDASLQACIQFYKEQLPDLVSLSAQRIALRRQLAEITAANLQEQCRDGQLLYAAYVDDFMLAQVHKQPAQSDTAMDNCFVSGLCLAGSAILF